MVNIQELLEQLNDFTTVSTTLQWLFEEFNPKKQEILSQLLFAQTSDPLDGMCSDNEIPQLTPNMLLLVMGRPALLFAASIYDEELSLLIWRGFVAFHECNPTFSLLRQVMDNTMDGHGFSSLHYAIEAQMNELFMTVCHWFAKSGYASKFRRMVQVTRTRDVVLPMSSKQVQGKNIASGGCTLLHLAVKRGELDMVHMLMNPPVALSVESVGCDWDGLSPLHLAILHKHTDIALFIDTQANFTMIDTLQKARDSSAMQRYAQSMITQAPFTNAQRFHAIWTPSECHQVVTKLFEFTDRYGWSKQRHVSYPTTDIPSYQIVPLDAWVRATIQHRLFTQVYAHYEIPQTKMLIFRELFYVKYEAQPGEQAELALHCDGSVLSFNILLNSRKDFIGGGTYFEANHSTLHIEQGDALVHSGKVRHSGASVIQGKRLLLVGFLDLVDRLEW